MFAQLISQPPVFITSWVELVTLSITATAGTWVYRHLNCRKTGCPRLGLFTHGHLRLCHLHHPLTPDDGRITTTHIRRVSP